MNLVLLVGAWLGRSALVNWLRLAIDLPDDNYSCFFVDQNRWNILRTYHQAYHSNHGRFLEKHTLIYFWRGCELQTAVTRKALLSLGFRLFRSAGMAHLGILKRIIHWVFMMRFESGHKFHPSAKLWHVLQNPWNAWFASVDLRKTILQDVERTSVV